YWVRPDIENRIKEGSIAARFGHIVKEIRPTSIVLTPCVSTEARASVERAKVDGRGEPGRSGGSSGPDTEEELPADAVYLLTGYRADTDLMVRAGVELTERHGPVHDPVTFETNVPGLFVAGAATRITDLFNDARQPTWSPDGRWITYFAYRDGGYDVWALAPDGSHQHKLTWGPFDDREPIWSHDGTRVAFSSDRGSPLGSDYNIWTLDVKTGELRQMTKNAADDYMPSWSPDD